MFHGYRVLDGEDEKAFRSGWCDGCTTMHAEHPGTVYCKMIHFMLYLLYWNIKNCHLQNEKLITFTVNY